MLRKIFHDRAYAKENKYYFIQTYNALIYPDFIWKNKIHFSFGRVCTAKGPGFFFSRVAHCIDLPTSNSAFFSLFFFPSGKKKAKLSIWRNLYFWVSCGCQLFLAFETENFFSGISSNWIYVHHTILSLRWIILMPPLWIYKKNKFFLIFITIEYRLIKLILLLFHHRSEFDNIRFIFEKS